MRNLITSSPPGAKVLQIRELEATYLSSKGDVVRALGGISLDIYQREVLAILGESGCGKSTLANAVLRLLPPHARSESGEIIFKDRNLFTMRERELRAIRGRDISLISQDPALALNPVLRVGTQISEVLRAHLPLNAKQRLERVRDLLAQVGFDEPNEIAQSYPHQLSGGQRQRIVIAQAMACDPCVIIADEPTSKLDASLRNEIVNLLLKISEKNDATLVMISHDSAMVAGIADRVAVMLGGKIVEIGACAEIFERPVHPYTQALVRLAKNSTIAAVSAKAHFPVPDETSDFLPA